MTIKYEDFTKIDLRVATILEAKPHPNADKLMILKVSLGTEERQIVAGIRQHLLAYEPENIIGMHVIIVANLEPITLRGEVSNGMLLATSDNESFSLITTGRPIKAGSIVR